MDVRRRVRDVIYRTTPSRKCVGRLHLRERRFHSLPAHPSPAPRIFVLALGKERPCISRLFSCFRVLLHRILLYLPVPDHSVHADTRLHVLEAIPWIQLLGHWLSN
jgi:hypothetical protein